MVNLFSGGALLQLSVFALGIMPYITASIIVQLLVVVIPRFEALKKEGQAGQAKLTQYTRYLTIGLGDPAVDGDHLAGARVPGGCSRAAASSCCPDQSITPDRHDGPHDDRRHRRSSCGSASSSPTAASATACRC